MSRRGLTLLLSFVLAIGLAAAGGFQTVPYVALTPGPAFNTLGSVNGKTVLGITGHASFKDTGSLDLVTVSVTDKITLFAALKGWLSSSDAVVPREVVFPPQQSQQQADQQNAQEMTASQNSATTAAFSELGLPMTTSYVVGAVSPGSAADGKLKINDVLLTVDGQKIVSGAAVGMLIGKHQAGDTVQIGYSRDGVAGTASLITRASTDKPVRPVIGISVSTQSVSPIKVSITLDDVGGPSAGMMFALGIIDKLGTQSLTGGKFIAGTGEITADGKVGAIGGIAQKMRGARAQGATVFLSPAQNCAEAKSNKPAGILLVKVSTLKDALAALATLRAGGTPPAC